MTKKATAWISKKDGPVDAAVYNQAASMKQLRKAWKTSEFDQALHFSSILKTVDPIAEFLESEAPLTRADRLKLAKWIRSFGTPRKKRGRPKGRLEGEFHDAQRNAVHWVQLGQRRWLNENPGRKQVPPSVTNALIAEAIDLASKDFPTVKLSPDEVGASVNKRSREIIG